MLRSPRLPCHPGFVPLLFRDPTGHQPRDPTGDSARDPTGDSARDPTGDQAIIH